MFEAHDLITRYMTENPERVLLATWGKEEGRPACLLLLVVMPTSGASRLMVDVLSL